MTWSLRWRKLLTLTKWYQVPENEHEPIDPRSAEQPELACRQSGPYETSPGPLQTWVKHDSYIAQMPVLGKRAHCGMQWGVVKAGAVLADEVIDPQKGKSLYKHPIPKEVMHIQSCFHSTPQGKQSVAAQLSVHHLRQLKSQVGRAVSEPHSMTHGKRFLAAEVFSPPRFAPLAEAVGAMGKSYNLQTGFDFTRASDRDQVAKELRENPPNLLILCPPCADEGGCFNLNSLHMDASEYVRRVQRSRMFIRLCCKLFEQQWSCSDGASKGLTPADLHRSEGPHPSVQAALMPHV